MGIFGSTQIIHDMPRYGHQIFLLSANNSLHENYLVTVIIFLKMYQPQLTEIKKQNKKPFFFLIEY